MAYILTVMLSSSVIDSVIFCFAFFSEVTPVTAAVNFSRSYSPHGSLELCTSSYGLPPPVRLLVRFIRSYTLPSANPLCCLLVNRILIQLILRFIAEYQKSQYFFIIFFVYTSLRIYASAYPGTHHRPHTPSPFQ